MRVNHLTEPAAENELVAKLRHFLETMYGGYLAGDRAEIDKLLDDELTMFDSASARLIEGIDELQLVRDQRPAPEDEQVRITDLKVLQPRARVEGGVVVATWWLQIEGVEKSGESVIPEMCRNTAVMRERGGKLVLLHIHEDVWQPMGGPERDLPELA